MRATISASSASVLTKAGAMQRLVARVAVRGGLGRVHEQATLERLAVDAARHVERGIEERPAVARVRVVDAEQEAVAAHLAHEIAPAQGLAQLGQQARATLRHPFHEPLPAETVDHREADRALERGATPGMSELERRATRSATAA